MEQNEFNEGTTRGSIIELEEGTGKSNIDIRAHFRDLPKEILIKILVLTSYSPSGYSVCQAWKTILSSQMIARHVCLERWGDSIAAINYDQLNALEKQKLHKEYFIPLVDGKVDWKRYYLVRSNYEPYVQYFFGYKPKSDLKRERVNYYLKVTRNTFPFVVVTSHVIAVTFRLLCDIGRICAEQDQEDENSYLYYESRLFSEISYSSKLEAVQRRIRTCKIFLEFYHLAKLNNWQWAKKPLHMALLRLFFIATTSEKYNAAWEVSMVYEDLNLADAAIEEEFIELIHATVLSDEEKCRAIIPKHFEKKGYHSD